MNKFISLFLVLSIFSLSGNLMAEEWGQKFTLVDQRNDSQQIIDEFIPVTFPPFLVMKPEFSVAVFSHNKGICNVQFHNQLKWPEKSNYWKILKGVAFGALIGGGGGAIIGHALGDDEPGFFSFTAGDKALVGAATGALIGGIIGGLIAAF